MTAHSLGWTFGLLAIAVGACATESTESPGLGHPPEARAPTSDERARCATATSEEAISHPTYWPAGAFRPAAAEFRRLNPSDTRDLDSLATSSGQFLADWFSRHLCAMGELPLAAPEPGHTRVRLLWLRTFHHPLAVRLEHDRRGTTLTAIELDGQGGYEPGAVLRRVERQLERREWEQLDAMLTEAQFWRSPTALVSLGADGANWILEVSQVYRYHVVERWGGSALGEYILTLTGLDLEPIY